MKTMKITKKKSLTNPPVEKFWEIENVNKYKSWYRQSKILFSILANVPIESDDDWYAGLEWDFDQIIPFVTQRIPEVKNLVWHAKYPKKLAIEALREDFDFIFRNVYVPSHVDNCLFLFLMLRFELCGSRQTIESNFNQIIGEDRNGKPLKKNLILIEFIRNIEDLDIDTVYESKSKNKSGKSLAEKPWETESETKYCKWFDDFEKIVYPKMVKALGCFINTSDFDGWNTDAVKRFVVNRLPIVKINIEVFGYPADLAEKELQWQFLYLFRYSTIPLDIKKFFWNYFASQFKLFKKSYDDTIEFIT